jgi:hypothetical protein
MLSGMPRMELVGKAPKISVIKTVITLWKFIMVGPNLKGQSSYTLFASVERGGFRFFSHRSSFIFHSPLLTPHFPLVPRS